MKNFPKLIIFGFLLTILWSLSLFFFYNQVIEVETENINKMALREAQVAYNKDLTYRRWAAGLGGIYAEISHKLKPNPHLDVPHRDVTTTEGKKLTLINPAYMTRMVYNLMKEDSGLTAHITSLNPIRLDNKPEPWEANVLKSFINEPSEFHAFATKDDETVLHYMKPMVTEKRCLKCHAKQGFKLGDVRGGISVTVPMAKYEGPLSLFKEKTASTFSFIWVFGMASILIVFTILNRIEQAREKAKEELARTKNYLSNIIDSMPSVLIGVDQEGMITQWNSEAEKVGKLKSQEAVGMPFSEALPNLKTEIDRVFKAMQSRTVRKNSVKSRNNKGSTCYEDITIYPLIANGVQGAVVRIDDITERVNLEQMMVQSEKMMSVGGLAAGMAHEINNPLAAILGHTQNIQKRTFGELKKNHEAAVQCNISLNKLREYMELRQIPKMIDGILDSGNRAARIVSNMLNFSRKSEKRHHPYQLTDLLDKTLELAANDYNLKKYYDFRKINVIKKYDKNLPPVFCDGNEIQQVFLNLLKNGAEAMTEKDYKDQSPQFICKVTTQGNMAIVEIEDNGPGITGSMQKRIFDPFFTTKEADKGTGLGLSVSYFIIKDQHNGSMEVDSTLGEWTRFTIKLPL